MNKKIKDIYIENPQIMMDRVGMLIGHFIDKSYTETCPIEKLKAEASWKAIDKLYDFLTEENVENIHDSEIVEEIDLSTL